MPETLKTSQWVPFPVELVFAFFANPQNLPHLMPKWQQAMIVSSRIVAPPARPVADDPALRFQSLAAGAGSEMVISFRPVPGIPYRMDWLARISEFEWNDHFCDEQVKGPFGSWNHCHRIVREVRDEIAGTLISDDLEYSLPLGRLGALANSVLVKRQMKSIFDYRQQQLIKILPEVAQQATRRN